MELTVIIPTGHAKTQSWLKRNKSERHEVQIETAEQVKQGYKQGEQILPLIKNVAGQFSEQVFW